MIGISATLPSTRNRLDRFAPVLGAVLVASIVGIAIATERWVLVAGILALLVAAIVLALPRAVVVAAVALNGSELLVPEPSHQLRVFVLAVVAVIAWRILDRLWSDDREPWTASRALTWAFLLVVVVTMALRGVGFQALGASKAGGLLYVRLIATAGFALLTPGVRLSDAQWRRALVGMCALASLPLLADLTAVYVRPLAGLSAAFFQLSPSVESLVYGTVADDGPFRWFSAMSLSTYVTLLLFLLEGEQRDGKMVGTVTAAGLIAAFVLASLSGHRLAILNVLGISTLVLLLDGRLTLRRTFVAAIALGVVLLSLAAVSEMLPPAIQRAISWIPGAHVSTAAGRSASDSVTWRLVVWLLALQEVPKYLLLGRGIAYEQSELTIARSAHLMSGEANWAIVEGYFHNGWLSLLILFGIAGLVTGFALLATATVRHFRLTREKWERPQLQRYHRVLTAWLIFQVFSYWIIYGDVQVSFPQLFFSIGLLEAVRSDDRATQKVHHATAASAAA